MHVPIVNPGFFIPRRKIQSNVMPGCFFSRYQAGEPYGADQKLGRKESYAASTVRVRQLLMVQWVTCLESRLVQLSLGR